ncbi:hypothetical protein Sjap_024252 [Stephania japonica]|uniref:Uncharacterized protein n=1 Tax=Stephania japonica TaxID=461633 RepID=A0AAP0ED29_9MAGN
MEERKLDIVLVPMGLGLMLMYHMWLLITVLRTPNRTVIGFNALVRERWVYSMMSDPLKNGTLVVQTLRNNLMAFSSLAATSITLSSIIGVFVSTTTNSKSSSEIVYGSKNPIINSIKHFSILLCFLFAFLCNIQAIRYYSHVSFLMTLPAMADHDYIDDDSQCAKTSFAMSRGA